MNYRDKIYKNYSSKRIGKLAPANIAGFNLRAPFLKKIIRTHFQENRGIRILEIGCGHGAFQHFILRAGYSNSVGIDASEEQVREANRLGIKNVIHANLVDYIKNAESHSVDLLVAFDVIEHFTKQELSDLVDEFYRILRPGGKIICHVPNGEGPFGNFIRTGDFTHELAFTRQSIAQLFLSSGFKEVNSYEDKPTPHGLQSFARYILWEYGVRNIYRLLVLIETGGADKDSIFSQNLLTIVKK